MELDMVDGAKQLPPPPKLPDTTTSSIMLTIEMNLMDGAKLLPPQLTDNSSTIYMVILCIYFLDHMPYGKSVFLVIF